MMNTPRHRKACLTSMITFAIAAILQMGCDSSSKSTGSTDNGDGILSGSVLDHSGKGIANASIKLRSSGQTTLTDADGKWTLQPNAARSVAGRTAEAATDSVIVSKDSQYIASQPVTSYTTELPPLYIVQRDLYGSLANFQEGTYTVTAYLTFPDSTTKVIPLWHNTVAHAFSGFIYTVYTAQTVDYSVRVIVREDSAITGLSPVVPFNSTAGDVTIPVFSYRNITPTVALSVSGAVRIDNEVTITATVGDTDVVNGYMISDNTKNSIFWKHVTAGTAGGTGVGTAGGVGSSVTNGSSNWVLGSKSLSVKIDASVLRDSCYAVKVVDDQDSLVTESQYCFDLSAGATKLSGFSAHVGSRKTVVVRADTVATLDGHMEYSSRPTDTISVGDFKVVNNSDNYKRGANGDTINISSLDATKRIFITEYDSANVLQKTDTAVTDKKTLATVLLDSFDLAGYLGVKATIWSEKPSVITFFGDTVALKAGDNALVASKAFTNRDVISLRFVPNDGYYVYNGEYGRYVAYLTQVSIPIAIQAYLKAYATYLYTGVKATELSGTYANGLLKLDNSDANDGKFVIKSLVGYK